MASANSFFTTLLLSLIFFFFLINGVTCDRATDDRINTICREQEQYGFCVGAFKQNLQAESADYVSLTGLTIHLVQRNATHANKYIGLLLRNTRSDPVMRNALQVCQNAYQIVIDSFNAADNSFQQKDYDGMLMSERVTPRAQASCSTIFLTPPNPKNPLQTINWQMRILITMAIVTGHNIPAI